MSSSSQWLVSGHMYQSMVSLMIPIDFMDFLKTCNIWKGVCQPPQGLVSPFDHFHFHFFSVLMSWFDLRRCQTQIEKTILDTMLCAAEENKDACKGDSGGN